MTPDPDGAKAFYDAVVGWNIGEGAAEFNGYRMIGAADGGFAGGVLPMTDEMQQHGARPTWLGYIHVDDVDAAVATIEAAGGKALMPATDIPNVGRIAMVADPQGAPFYVMKPIPPEGRENEQSDVFSPDAGSASRWNELSTSDPAAARTFLRRAVRLGPATTTWRWARWANIASSTMTARRLGAMCRRDAAASRRTGAYYFRVPSIVDARRRPPKPRAGRSPWARWRCRAATISSSASTRRAPSSRSSAKHRGVR